MLNEMCVSFEMEDGMARDKYIMFMGRQIGSDGYKYIQNVKYRIHHETAAAFYLMGKDKKSMNKLLKSKLKEKYTTGEIIRDKGAYE